MKIQFLDLTLLCLIVFHLYCSPFTKVEESFALQAIRDFVKVFDDPSSHAFLSFDHFEFPGAVPRSFAPLVLLASLTSIVKKVLTISSTILKIDLNFNGQLVSRFVLGFLNWISIVYFRSVLASLYGSGPAFWYIVLQQLQFHYIYYSTRTIYNFIATPIVLYATSLALSAQKGNIRRMRYCLGLLCIASIVIRSEIAPLVGLFLLLGLQQREASLFNLLYWSGFYSALALIVLVVPLDSIMWKQAWMWPEAQAFIFNVYQGKSSDWGVQPIYYYSINALPKLLFNPFAVIFFILAMFSRSFKRTRLAKISMIYTAFIFIMSLLPHKEWRFIIYCIPTFTAMAAFIFDYVAKRKFQNIFWLFIFLLLLGSCVVTFVLQMVFLYISHVSYPGGYALLMLQKLEARDSVSIYADVYSCMTGISLFTLDDLPAGWNVDRTENLELLSNQSYWEQRDWVLTLNTERFAESKDWILVTSTDVQQKFLQELKLKYTVNSPVAPNVYLMLNTRRVDPHETTRILSRAWTHRLWGSTWQEIEYYMTKLVPPEFSVPYTIAYQNDIVKGNYERQAVVFIINNETGRLQHAYVYYEPEPVD